MCGQEHHNSLILHVSVLTNIVLMLVVGLLYWQQTEKIENLGKKMNIQLEATKNAIVEVKKPKEPIVVVAAPKTLLERTREHFEYGYLVSINPRNGGTTIIVRPNDDYPGFTFDLPPSSHWGIPSVELMEYGATDTPNPTGPPPFSRGYIFRGSRYVTAGYDGYVFEILISDKNASVNLENDSALHHLGFTSKYRILYRTFFDQCVKNMYCGGDTAENIQKNISIIMNTFKLLD